MHSFSQDKVNSRRTLPLQDSEESDKRERLNTVVTGYWGDWELSQGRMKSAVSPFISKQ